LVSTFHSSFGGRVPISYTIVFLLFSGRALVLGDARVEMEREFAEGKKPNFGALVHEEFPLAAEPARRDAQRGSDFPVGLHLTQERRIGSAKNPT
jgi:hypothetical protein